MSRPTRTVEGRRTAAGASLPAARKRPTDLVRYPVEGEFGGADVIEAIPGHVLTEARVTGGYALNSDVAV